MYSYLRSLTHHPRQSPEIGHWGIGDWGIAALGNHGLKSDLTKSNAATPLKPVLGEPGTTLPQRPHIKPLCGHETKSPSARPFTKTIMTSLTDEQLLQYGERSKERVVLITGAHSTPTRRDLAD